MPCRMRPTRCRLSAVRSDGHIGHVRPLSSPSLYCTGSIAHRGDCTKSVSVRSAAAARPASSPTLLKLKPSSHSPKRLLRSPPSVSSENAAPDLPPPAALMPVALPPPALMLSAPEDVIAAEAPPSAVMGALMVAADAAVDAEDGSAEVPPPALMGALMVAADVVLVGCSVDPQGRSRPTGEYSGQGGVPDEPKSDLQQVATDRGRIDTRLAQQGEIGVV